MLSIIFINRCSNLPGVTNYFKTIQIYIMSNLSLSSEINLEVTARFIAKGSDAPLTGTAYTLRLFDKDIFDDDYLGESPLDANGVAKIKFNHTAFSDIGTIETIPRFYFSLLKNGEQIFQSKVMEELDIDAIEQFKMGEGEVIDLGTFLVEG